MIFLKLYSALLAHVVPSKGTEDRKIGKSIHHTLRDYFESSNTFRQFVEAWKLVVCTVKEDIGWHA